MKVSYALLVVVVPTLAPSAAAQTPNPHPTWQFKPALYTLGSIDESSDLPFGRPALDIGEASPTANVAAGLDFGRETSHERFRGALFGLLRSPFDGGDRSFFGAGRIEESKMVGGGRLTFTDGFKIQARPQLEASDYWGNAATLRGEWSRPSGRGFGVQVGDRRRTLSELDILSFSRQSAGVGVFAPLGTRGRAELSADFQHYSATTATGERLLIGAEFGTFSRSGIATLRIAWFEPISDRRRTSTDTDNPGEEIDFGDIGRAEFFEILALQGTYGAVLGDAFFLDPLQSDSDEWDFGRRKQVVTGFASRRLGARTTAAAFLRLQHKSGPDLLLPEGAEGAASFTDDRFEVRGALRYQVSRQMALLLQGSYLKNWSERPNLEFFRLLGAVGVQIQF